MSFQSVASSCEGKSQEATTDQDDTDAEVFEAFCEANLHPERQA